jgi:excisionase family DNA binding protein
MQTITNTPDNFLAPKEAAARLGVHVSAIYRAIERGDLPVVRLGRRGAIRIPVSALDAKPQAAADA